MLGVVFKILFVWRVLGMNEFKGCGIFFISLKIRVNGFFFILIFVFYDILIFLNFNEYKKK